MKIILYLAHTIYQEVCDTGSHQGGSKCTDDTGPKTQGKTIYIYITFMHLVEAFIQTDFQKESLQKWIGH